MLMQQGDVPVAGAGYKLGLVGLSHMILSTVDSPSITSLPIPRCRVLDDWLECWGDLVLSVWGNDRPAVAMSVVPVQVDGSIPLSVSCVKMGEDS